MPLVINIIQAMALITCSYIDKVPEIRKPLVVVLTTVGRIATSHWWCRYQPLVGTLPDTGSNLKNDYSNIINKETLLFLRHKTLVGKVIEIDTYLGYLPRRTFDDFNFRLQNLTLWHGTNTI